MHPHVKQEVYMYCPHCGAPIDADSKFCASCGNTVEPEAPTGFQSQPQQTPQPAPVNNTVYVQAAEQNEPVSVGRWIGVFFLGIIPIAGLVLLFVWAFGGTNYKSLKNYARAMLILELIAVSIAIIVTIIVFIVAAGTSRHYAYSYYY